MKNRRRLFLAIGLAVILIAIFAVPVAADTSQDVTVTATPAYIAIANAPGTWTLDGITGDSKCAPDTIYYANPGGDTTAPSATVVDGECRFQITNTSNVAIDLTVNCSDFTGGSDPMTNSDDGSNGVGIYGGHSWYSGMTYSGKVIMKTTGSSVLKDALAAITDIKWGAEIETQSDDWAGSSSSTATMTITATED